MQYLIVGGGNTAHAAAAGIREHDRDGEIVLVSAEQHLPYKRPPLSKKLWSGGDESKLWLRTDELDGVDIRLGSRIVEIDAAAHTATDDQGRTDRYGKLLLATGGRPRTLPASEGVTTFRTLDDYRELRRRATPGARVVVVGGGFIGSELAAALNGAGCRVTMIVPEQAIGARLFPHDLAAFVTDYYRARGVEVLTGESVARVERSGDELSVQLATVGRLTTAVVVAGLGIEPRVELAAAAGGRIDNGIVVDDHARVEGLGDVYAAGDVASFPVPALGRRMRVEHEDHARAHGALAGANMAGADDRYDHLPFFYSDLFDLGYEAVGELDSRQSTITDWSTPNREGIVYYLDDAGRPRGVLLWNLFGRVEAARELIRAGEPVHPGAFRQQAAA